jgi:hypothetical protein
MYEADRGVIVESGRVTEWHELNGSGKHLVQASAANRPAYVENDGDGKPALRFTAASSEYLSFAGTLADPNEDFTVIAVLNHANLNDSLWGQTNSTTANANFWSWRHLNISSTYRLLTTVGGEDSELTRWGSTPDAWSLHCFRRAGDTMSARTNALTDVEMTAPLGTITTDTFTLGALNNGGGFVAFLEGAWRGLYIWQRYVDDVELVEVLDVLRNKWPGLP